MLPINRKITPYNFTPMNNKKNQYIVIHYTGSTGSAKNNADYFARESLSASANYFVDDDSIWQSVEDYNKAWHCGGGLQGSSGHVFYGKCTNSNSIGIEMCCKKDSNGNLYITDKTVNNTIDLIVCIMKKYNIDINHIIRHYDVTGKQCPAPYVNDIKWNTFKNIIIERMEGLSLTQYEELKESIEKIENDIIKDQFIYNYVDENMPSWARPTINKLIRKGYLKGDGKELNLTYDMMRILVINDRTGIYGE